MASNTPAGAQKYERNELRPLPTRISQHSYERLERVRQIDDLTIQEHVRRAIDYYLDHLEVSIALAASTGFDGAMQTTLAKLRENAFRSQEVVPALLKTHAPTPVRGMAKVATR